MRAVSWSLSVGPVSQDDLSDALETARDASAESQGGYSDEARKQQDEAFDALDDLAAKLPFHGNDVRVTAAGHSQNEEKTDAANYVSISIYEVVPE